MYNNLCFLYKRSISDLWESLFNIGFDHIKIYYSDRKECKDEP